MSQNDDYQKLARKFIDLWQEHMAAMMNDSDFIRMMLQMMQNIPFSAKDGSSYANPFTPKPSESAAAASDAHDAALARIAYSLAAIEERLRKLESAFDEQSESAPKPKAEKSGARVGRTAQRPKARRSSRTRNKKKGH